jgi:hypothetical protein
MKKALTIVVAGAALAATLSFVAAGASKREPVQETDALPAYEIVATVRAHGLAPIGELALRWPYYVLHANDPRGIEVRVVVDAQFGDILSVAPARPLATAYTPRYERGARIIQVPQAGERDEPAATNDDAAEEVAPPAPRRVTPRPKPRSEASPVAKRRSAAPLPPPPGSRRYILSAPPPPPAEGPSSIRPTPRFNSKTEPVERFGSPGNLTISPSTPPPGYSPPAALPRDVTSNNPLQPPGTTPPAVLPLDN